MAFLASEQYDRVVKDSTLLLQDDPNHVKTMARRGTAGKNLPTTEDRWPRSRSVNSCTTKQWRI